MLRPQRRPQSHAITAAIGWLIALLVACSNTNQARAASPHELPPVENFNWTDTTEGRTQRLPPVFDQQGRYYAPINLEGVPAPVPFGSVTFPDESTEEPGSYQSATIVDPPGNGGAFGSKPPFSLRSFWAAPTSVQGQNSDLGMNMQCANGAIPLPRLSSDHSITLGIASFQRLELSSSAILPGTTQSVPNQLWMLQMGLMHTRELANDWRGGGMFLFGSASDQPFAALRDMTLLATAFASHPAANQRDSWDLSVSYSPTSQLPYPLPGVAYHWRPSPWLEASIGLPAALLYRPTDQWSFAVSYLPLTNFGARGMYQLNDKWWFYGAYQIYNETYFLSDRVETRERFYVFDQRVSLGLERALRAGFSVDFAVLYMFDRQLFQGENFTDNQNALQFDPGVGLTAQLLWRR